jgi:hypothetical protein
LSGWLPWSALLVPMGRLDPLALTVPKAPKVSKACKVWPGLMVLKVRRAIRESKACLVLMALKVCKAFKAFQGRTGRKVSKAFRESKAQQERTARRVHKALLAGMS